MRSKLDKQFFRFCAVGIVNTVVDIPTFVFLHDHGVPILIANICSTSLALICSWLLNSRFTFKTNGRSLSRNEITIYIVVTMIGLWAIQPAVIAGVISYMTHYGDNLQFIRHIHSIRTFNNTVAKVCATSITFIWNYLWYSRAVFKHPTDPVPGIEILTKK